MRFKKGGPKKNCPLKIMVIEYMKIKTLNELSLQFYVFVSN